MHIHCVEQYAVYCLSVRPYARYHLSSRFTRGAYTSGTLSALACEYDVFHIDIEGFKEQSMEEIDETNQDGRSDPMAWGRCLACLACNSSWHLTSHIRSDRDTSPRVGVIPFRVLVGGTWWRDGLGHVYVWLSKVAAYYLGN